MAKLIKSWAALPLVGCVSLLLGCTVDDEQVTNSKTDAVVDAVSETVGCTMTPAEVSTPVDGVPAPRRSLRCESPDVIVLVHEYDSVAALHDMIGATGYCHPHISVGPVLVEAVDPVSREHTRPNGGTYFPEVPSIHGALQPLGAMSGRC